MNLKHIFNQSLTFVGFRCKRDVKGGGVKDCSAPRKWINGDRKCFTFDSPEEHVLSEDRSHVSLFAQKNDLEFDLFVHASHALPLKRETRVLHVTREHSNDIEIEFFSTIEEELKNCSKDEDSNDCLFKCVQHVMHERCHCVSRFAFIRETDLNLFENDLNFCFSQNTCENETLFTQHVLNTCHESCPRACLDTHFNVRVRETEARDLSETNITIKRAFIPDLVLRHVARVTCTEMIALFGGLLAFWTIISILLNKFFDFIHILWEFLEIYCI